MKTWENWSFTDPVCSMWSGRTRPMVPSGRLYLVSVHELEDLQHGLARGELPSDFEAKLVRLAKGDLLQQFLAQNCRRFVALLRALQEGVFQADKALDRERLLRVLAYVRKDDDAIPDYRLGGFADDQQEVRAALEELGPWLHAFKVWRLQHQVPGMWQN